ncbi:outer membrane protein transport protein [Desulfobacterales bacterium HSG16]|nr:outer membrane protein transport protein [Desulfobacterales bacterium HSG16]
MKLFYFVICLISLFFFPYLSSAQQFQWIDIPASPNPVGSGARALGMGGAFIAVADDATSASWNPGGLIQLKETEFSIVGTCFHRIEDNGFGAMPEASGRQSISAANLNYLSFAYPFNLMKRNMIVSVNYQYLYDFNREWNFVINHKSELFTTDRHIQYKQKGWLSAVGLAYCIQVTPRFSLGFTVNIWKDGLGKNDWKQETFEKDYGIHLSSGKAFTDEYYTSDKYTFDGFNANLGMLWNVNDHFIIGAVIKTPFSADLKHEVVFESSQSTQVTNYTEDETLDMPLSYGVGIAYRFSDNLTLSGDIYRTEWQDFILENANGTRISLISGLPEAESDIDPVLQVRVGMEYLFIRPKSIIPIRAGFFYDPAPAEGSPDDFFGFSMGSGIAVGSCVFDAAYQYRFGNGVGQSAFKHLGFSQDIDEHSFYASLIYHF